MRWPKLRPLTAVLLVVAFVPACSGGGPVRTPAPTARPVERIPIDGRPSAVAVAEGKVFVADDENHVVHVFDERTRRATRDAIDVEADPISMDADRGVVWVGHAGGRLTRIEAESLDATAITIGGSVTDVVAEDGGVWTIDLEGGAVAEIDASSGDVIRGVPVPRGAVRGAVGKEGLWVSGDDDDISRVELEPFVVRHVYEDAGDAPIGLAWDGHVMWAAMSGDGTIVDVEGKTHEDPVPVGRGPVALAVVGGSVYVANQDDETVVRVRDGRAQGDPIALGASPRDMAATADALWIACAGSNAGPRSNVLLRAAI